jgi:hypothetical protein
MDAEQGTILDRAIQSWGKAQVLYTGPTLTGLPEPLELAQKIAADYPQFHDGLVALLSSSDQLVAAYALLTLRMMGSPVLANLPAELLSRKGQVTVVMGCFLNAMDLGGLARQYQKEAQRKP